LGKEVKENLEVSIEKIKKYCGGKDPDEMDINEKEKLINSLLIKE
jgi:hypothetical protein